VPQAGANPFAPPPPRPGGPHPSAGGPFAGANTPSAPWATPPTRPGVAPADRPTARTVAPAVAAGTTALISLLIGWARYAGNWANSADQNSDPSRWPYAAWLTSLEVVFALVGFASALAVVLPRAGRRPVFVGLLVVVALVTGAAVSDGFYQIVSSLYYNGDH
jgi:hypothetical protein